RGVPGQRVRRPLRAVRRRGDFRQCRRGGDATARRPGQLHRLRRRDRRRRARRADADALGSDAAAVATGVDLDRRTVPPRRRDRRAARPQARPGEYRLVARAPRRRVVATHDRLTGMSERIEKLLSEMTLEEKVSLTAGEDWWHTPAIERLGVPRLK